MRTTQKQLIETFKRTKNRMTVFSFDPETKRRYGTYSGLDMREALNEVMYKTAQGYLVLICSRERFAATDPINSMVFKYERTHKARIPMQNLVPYAISNLSDIN